MSAHDVIDLGIAAITPQRARRTATGADAPSSATPTGRDFFVFAAGIILGGALARLK